MPGLAQTAHRGIALLTPYLGARWGTIISAILQPPYPWERTLAPTVYEAVWAPGQVWTDIEDKISCLHQDSNPGPYSI